MLNELALFLIGTSFALLANLYMPSNQAAIDHYHDVVLLASHGMKKRSSIIIVAEGAANSGTVVDYIREHTYLEANLTVLGYIQRGGSPTAYDSIMAGLFAQKAVGAFKLATSGATQQSNCISPSTAKSSGIRFKRTAAS